MRKELVTSAVFNDWQAVQGLVNTRGQLIFAAPSPLSQSGVWIAANGFDELETPSVCDELDAMGTGKIDLELQLTASNLNPGKYKQVDFQLSVQNASDTDATDLLIGLRTCEEGYNFLGLFFNSLGVVYANTNVEASTGLYQSLIQQWSIPQLEAGQTETLQFSLYTLTDTPINILAQVLHAAEEDIDASANFTNYAICAATEDDEAFVQLNTMQNATSSLENRQTQPIYFVLYPNPVQQDVSVEWASEIATIDELKIYDNKGQLRFQQKVGVEIGVNNFRLNLAKLEAGIYFITNLDRSHYKTFIKLDDK